MASLEQVILQTGPVYTKQHRCFDLLYTYYITQIIYSETDNWLHISLSFSLEWEAFSGLLYRTDGEQKQSN